MPLASTRSGHIWYELEGEGPLTVLVTGLAGDASYWDPQTDLRRHRRVLTYDHIGVGRSHKPHGEYSVGAMASDLIALLDSLEIAKADFVGHSTGGCILQILAAEAPERLNRVVAASSWLESDWRFERLFRLRQAALHSNGASGYAKWGALMNYPPDWIMSRLAELQASEEQVAARMDAEIVSERINAVLRFDGRRYVSAIEAPVTVVAARDDQVTPPHMSEALAQALPQAKTTWFDAGGHCFTAVHATEFNEFILRELSS